MLTPRLMAILAAIAVGIASCGNTRDEKGLHSPTSRLLGHHVNLPNTVTRLVERGSLSNAELREILQADRAWFRERKPIEGKPLGVGKTLGADADAVLKLLHELERGPRRFPARFRQGHGEELNLRGKDLRWANLTRSTEHRQDLFGFDMTGANLSGLRQPGFRGVYQTDDGRVLWRSFTDSSNANLLGAQLTWANLSETNLRGALLLGVDFEESNLGSADLYEADLRWAEFSRADLTNADVGRADLAGVLYEPLAGAHPEITSFISAKNISRMRWDTSPAALLELREAFRKGGLREQERAATFAIKRSERLKAATGPALSKTQSLMSLVFLEWTVAYGMHPWRALMVVMALIPVFAVFYAVALFGSGRSAIWALRMERAVRSSEKSRPVRVTAAVPSASGATRRLRWILRAGRLACYFSLLQAFRVGFREANVGEWIERLQAREYVLRATGWVRTVAGIQSLISVYLLAIWIITLFGGPLD